MKNPIRTMVAVSVISFAASHIAFADEAETERVWKSLDAAVITAPMLQISVENGVATLSGTVEDPIEKEKIVAAVKSTEGVTEVLDNIGTD